MSDNNHRYWIRLSQVGLQMGVTIFLGAKLGIYLDERNNSNKTYTIILTLVSCAIAFYSVLKQVNKLNDDQK